jgi:hypothetical protein
MTSYTEQIITASSDLRRKFEGEFDRIVDKAADKLDAFNRSMDPIAGAPTDDALQAEVDELLRPALARDLARVQRQFAENDEYAHVEAGLPAELIDRIRREVIVSHATRSVWPWHRAAGSIGYRRIQVEAPVTAALYRSSVMRDYVSALSGKPIHCRSDDDDHACTFYVYSRPGDQMAYHYDVCGCEDGASYSLIIGVTNDCTQKLLVELHRGDPTRKQQSLQISTTPGTLITFSGSKLWHGVSKLGHNELRVTLGLAYVTTTYQPPTRRFTKVMADTLFHFGLGGLLKRAASAIER